MPATTLRVTQTPASRLTEAVRDEAPFGTVFADHMLVAQYADGAWNEPDIRPYGPMAMSPSIVALHYGQALFEGFKAYRTPAGPAIFRMRDNFARLNRTAARMCMPPVPEDIFVAGITALVQLDREWIPTRPGASLYIRPVYFATEEVLNVRPASKYMFVVLTAPVPPYFAGAVNLLAEEQYVRAFPGGTGDIKPAANYGGAMLAAQGAQARGFHHVLWLDGIEHRWIEEGGLMNVMFVVDGTIVTPPLGGTILPGIVRDSVLTLARGMGIPVEERRIAIDELFALHEAGRVTEAAAVGTAASVASIGRIRWRDREADFTPRGESLIARIGDRLDAIRTGRAPDTHGWLTIV